MSNGNNEKLLPLVREPNNLLIWAGCKTDEAKEFYLRLSIAEVDVDGQYISLLQLYAKEIDENCEEIIALLNDTSNRWHLNITYVLSNSCKVYVNSNRRLFFQ